MQLMLLDLLSTVCAVAVVAVVWRWRSRVLEVMGELGLRVLRLEDRERLQLRVVVRTYGQDPGAGPFEIRPVSEQIVLSASLAVLADLYRYRDADQGPEMSLIAPFPQLGVGGFIQTGEDTFVDVVLTRGVASHG
jgi:hypothetical protein